MVYAHICCAKSHDLRCAQYNNNKDREHWLTFEPMHIFASHASYMTFIYQLIKAELRRYMYASVIKPPLVQIMAWRLVGAKPLSDPKLEYCQFNPQEQTPVG